MANEYVRLVMGQTQGKSPNGRSSSHNKEQQPQQKEKQKQQSGQLSTNFKSTNTRISANKLPINSKDNDRNLSQKNFKNTDKLQTNTQNMNINMNINKMTDFNNSNMNNKSKESKSKFLDTITKAKLTVTYQIFVSLFI